MCAWEDGGSVPQNIRQNREDRRIYFLLPLVLCVAAHIFCDSL